jgi:hypothetical protein
MKKTPTQNDLVSKSYLKKALRPFATKKDLERFATKKDLERFATKKDLERFATKVDLYRVERRIDDLEEKFTNKLTEFKEKILMALDTVMGELKAIRQEITALTGLYQRHEEKLENHEERITELEKPKFA